jgi:hypothetical protein
MLKKYPEIFGTNVYRFFYDLACGMRSLNKLEFGNFVYRGQNGQDETKAKTEFTFILIPYQDCPDEPSLRPFKKIKMLVRFNDSPIILGNKDKLSADMSNQCHEQQQFFELLTSQYPLFNPYVLCRLCSMFIQ